METNSTKESIKVDVCSNVIHSDR
ncbi:MAG: hypothetical protein ACLUD1_02325 [Clostridia bacterium]